MVNMPLDFVMFTAVVLLANVIFDLVTAKILHIPGFDFLFYAPWIAAINFGIYNAVILAGTLLIIHTIFNVRIANFILMSFPAQLVAVGLGILFGFSGFWISLALYLLISSITTYFSGGFGGRYFTFLIVSTIFNISLFIFIRTF